MNYESILHFWFKEIEQRFWFEKSDAFDEKLTNRFLPLVEKALRGELFHWRTSARGRLAEIIVLDQFTRNIFRDTPRSFSGDAIALTLSQEAVSLGLDKGLSEFEKSFMYMPYMHSESIEIHKVADALFKPLGNYDFEVKHREIIEKFGRYPHRNEILGRKSTPEEIEFLTQDGSSF